MNTRNFFFPSYYVVLQETRRRSVHRETKQYKTTQNKTKQNAFLLLCYITRKCSKTLIAGTIIFCSWCKLNCKLFFSLCRCVMWTVLLLLFCNLFLFTYNLVGHLSLLGVLVFWVNNFQLPSLYIQFSCHGLATTFMMSLICLISCVFNCHCNYCFPWLRSLFNAYCLFPPKLPRMTVKRFLVSSSGVWCRSLIGAPVSWKCVPRI